MGGPDPRFFLIHNFFTPYEDDFGTKMLLLW